MTDEYGAHRCELKLITPGRKFLERLSADSKKDRPKISQHPLKGPFNLKQGLHREEVVRSLIQGLSDHFDDLIMGIWGNTTLIRFNLSKDHPAYDRVAQMETMIQEGAYLIQLILGYLGERRALGKAIRLHQLVSHMACYLPKDEDHKHLAERLQKGTKAYQPRLIAGATARIIELLFKGIDTFRHSIVLETLDNPIIQQRIGIIAALLKKGDLITSQLRCYSGDIELHKKNANLGTLLKRQYRRALERHSHIRIKLLITPCLPRIPIDQKNIEWVIAEMIENTVRVMSRGGRLSLTLKPMYAEEPHQRCGVHLARDYVVLTIEDNGPGIAIDSHWRIFDPFYSHGHGHGTMKNTLGLGLSAANGIIRKHGGYIQVRSSQEQGGCFKVYLPVEE